MDTTRLERLTSAMKKEGLDALFVTNPKNVQYVTGIRAMMGGNALVSFFFVSWAECPKFDCRRTK